MKRSDKKRRSVRRGASARGRGRRAAQKAVSEQQFYQIQRDVLPISATH